MRARGAARWIAEVAVMLVAIVVLRLGLEAAGLEGWLAAVIAILVVAAGWTAVESRRAGDGS